MRRHVISRAVLLLVGAAALALPVLAQESAEDPPARPEPVEIGARVPGDVTVLPLAAPAPAASPASANEANEQGEASEGGARPEPREVSLVALLAPKGEPAKPLVVVFWSARCPVCRRYGPVLRELVKDYRDRVRFAFVCPNANEADEHLRGALGDAKLDVDAYSDKRQRAADRLGVRVTPVALLLDATTALRYRGPIDDDRRRRERDTTDHLRLALDALLEGRAVESPEPRPFGSSLRRAPADRR